MTNGRRRVFSGGAVIERGGRPPPEMARDGGAYRSMALEMARDPLEKPDPGAGEEEEEGREEEKGMAEAGNAGRGTDAGDEIGGTHTNRGSIGGLYFWGLASRIWRPMQNRSPSRRLTGVVILGQSPKIQNMGPNEGLGWRCA